MSGNAMLTEKHLTALHQFRSAVSDILKPHHDDEYLLRWLKARDFDVSKAEKMIRKSFKVMHNLQAENILNSEYTPPKVVEKYLPTRFWGCDKEGSPVRLILTGKLDFGGLYRSLPVFDMMQMAAYILESDLKCARENAEKTGKFNPKSVYVVDYKDIDFRQLMDKIVITQSNILLTLYQDNYPELLKTAYVINVPSFIHVLIALFKPLINENTWKKIRIFASDGWQNELFEHIDRRIVPKYYGGDLDDPYHDPSIFSANMEKIPSTYFVKDRLHLKAADPGTTEVVIQERQAYSHRINVQKVGSILKWVFQTKDYDVKFGVFFQTAQDIENKGALKELIKPAFFDTHHIPERGELRCEKVGEYILQFDNSYSWLMKKHLLLRVNIEEPVNELTSL